MTSEQDIMERLKPLLRDSFPDADIDAMGSNTIAADVVGWDSMAHVTLIVSIEETFGIAFAPEEITSFADLGELVHLIATKCGVEAR
jgi:acyl carrier protein